MNTIVVVGSGLAAYTLIRELRHLDKDVPVLLVSQDGADFYSKPMLSNGQARAIQLTPASEMAKKLDIRVMSRTEVLGIDRMRKKLRTSAGEICYDKLVLALGAEPARIDFAGDGEVLSVNNLSDYEVLQKVLNGAESVAIMGAGLIGCEFANDFWAAGFRVSVIDPGAYPVSALLPAEAGRQLELHMAGIDWIFGRVVTHVQRASSGHELTLSDGSTLHADAVLCAVGLRPRIELAREAGLAVNRGIVVNENLCSSDEDIYALGDCAEIGGRVRPFVQPIMHEAKALARRLCEEQAALNFPLMPVVIKTPAHPVVVLPVDRDVRGEWRMLDSGSGVKMGFFDAQGKLRGFALTGEYAVLRMEMTCAAEAQ